MHNELRSQNFYVDSILALGKESQPVLDSGHAENLKGKRKKEKYTKRGRGCSPITHSSGGSWGVHRDY
jgi:hypothetical protein